MKTTKSKLFRKGLLYDVIGVSTMFIPLIGPFIDILWAPYAAKKMSEMYDGSEGKIASAIVFIEELLPGLDFVPTFTLMWLYTFVWKKQKQDISQPIDVEFTE